MSVEHPRVGVIDDSAAVRETITVVLGADYDVDACSVPEFRRDPQQLLSADLLVIADDALPADALGQLSPGPPILWLQRGGGPPPLTLGRWAAIPHAFGPEELRAQVRALLAERGAPQPPLGGPTLIDYPVLPKEIVLLARRAASTHFPVLLCGEPGSGKSRLARAIHTFGRDGRFVAVSAGGCTRATVVHAAAIAAGSITVFVSDVAELASDGQQLLLELLDCGGVLSAAGWHRVRLICGTAHSFEALGRSQSLQRELFYRLSVLPITLPPLRERTQDIPALVAHVAASLARMLTTAPVTFSPRALERLTRYLWFGNLAELEAVLTRTIALTPSGQIDADDLLFGYGRLLPRGRASGPPPARAHAASAPPRGVDLVINELAHEFKNPMVTIKTVAQHLERLLADAAGRAEVARLTGEAVERMDRTLDNLLQFTRFRAPAPRPVTVNALLGPALTDLAPLLSERGVVLDYRPPEPFTVVVDAEQVAYAFDNLLHAAVRDLADGQTLSIHAQGSPSTLVFAFAGAGRSLAAKLADFLEQPQAGDDAALPLGVVFAKTLVERNGGRFAVDADSEATTITVWLPPQAERVAGNGQTTDPRS